MNRNIQLISILFASAACDGHEHLRLLDPTDDDNTVTEGGSGSSGGSGGSGVVSLPTPTIIFRNLMLIATNAELDGQTWSLDATAVTRISTAFTVTYPALISEFSAGNVVFDNDVISTTEPVTSVGFNADMVESVNFPGWENYVGVTGSYDCVFVVTARPQNNVYSAGSMTSSPRVAWVSDGPRSDYSQYGDAMGAWLFGWIASAKLFYADTLGLNNVPNAGDWGSFGYAWNRDGMDHYLAWYRDYLNRKIVSGGTRWGLGDEAWRLGTFRDGSGN